MSEHYIPSALSELTVTTVEAEAIRAHLKHGRHSMMNPAMDMGERLAILVEEVGEVAHAMTYDVNKLPELRKELIQVAAMALSWFEATRGMWDLKVRDYKL